MILANSRNEGSVRDPNEDEKMLRLFIIVPRGCTEQEVKGDFAVCSALSCLHQFGTDSDSSKGRISVMILVRFTFMRSITGLACSSFHSSLCLSVPYIENMKACRDKKSKLILSPL